MVSIFRPLTVEQRFAHCTQLVNISGGDILTSLGLDADQLRDLIDVFRPLGATFNDFNAVFAAQTSASVEFNDLVLTIDRSLGDSGELGFRSLGEPR